MSSKFKMILKPELIKKIKDYFDLNIYETKVWLALLGKGVATAGEVAEISSVPRSRTYDVLESLEKRGFAIAKLGKPVKYIAVKPTAVIEKLKSNTLKQAQERVKSLVNLKETQEYNELQELHKSGISPVKQEELSGAIKGKSNIYNHLHEILENAEKEIIIVCTAEEIESKSRIFLPVFSRLNKNKIKIKVALNSEKSQINKINKKFKIKAKKTDLEGRFFIVDGKEIVFPLSNNINEENDLAIWINSEFFASSLASMFDFVWRK